MPCLHCHIESVDRPRLAEVVDPRFPLERTMGFSGPRLAPEGHGAGRICGVCGVLFFPKKEPGVADGDDPEFPEVTYRVERKEVTAEEAAGIMADAPLPRFEVVGGEVPRGRLIPQMDGSYVEEDSRPFRVEKLVVPSDATTDMTEALRACGYQPLEEADWQRLRTESREAFGESLLLKVKRDAAKAAEMFEESLEEDEDGAPLPPVEQDSERARRVQRRIARGLSAEAARLPGADSSLHPSGRCTCGGEGSCEWCLSRCSQCGAGSPRDWTVAAEVVGIYSPGAMQQAKHLAVAAVEALGLVYDEAAPSDIIEAIERLKGKKP